MAVDGYLKKLLNEENEEELVDDETADIIDPEEAAIGDTPEEGQSGTTGTTITIKANDPDGKLTQILEEIKNRGNVGHSFSILVDPDAEDGGASFGWDGDGSDSIEEISVDGEVDEETPDEEDAPDIDLDGIEDEDDEILD